LFETQRFDWCLFIAHLVLEKTLKAHYVKNIGEIPPRTHDLVRLAALAKVEFDSEVLEFLDSVNTFNISTRYPDEKFKFYQLCTYEFARENFYRIKGDISLVVKADTDIDKVRRFIALLLENGVRVSEAYLFGSAARGEAGRHSDIDVAIVSSDFEGISYYDIKKISKYRQKVDLRLEVHPFSQNEIETDPPLFYRSIKSQGIRVH
jgi:HEPN domain-containing protein/predicted nucleotidyltransferase